MVVVHVENEKKNDRELMTDYWSNHFMVSYLACVLNFYTHKCQGIMRCFGGIFWVQFCFDNFRQTQTFMHRWLAIQFFTFAYNFAFILAIILSFIAVIAFSVLRKKLVFNLGVDLTIEIRMLDYLMTWFSLWCHFVRYLPKMDDSTNVAWGWDIQRSKKR